MYKLKFILDLNLYAETKKPPQPMRGFSLNRCLAIFDSLEPQSVEQRSTQQGESNAVMDVGSRITQELLSSWGQNGRKAILHSVSCPKGELHECSE